MTGSADAIGTAEPTRDGPVVAERPVPGTPRPYDFPAVAEHRLTNGLRILVADLPGRPLVSTSLIMPTGASDEPATEAGSTVMAARALSEGTEHYDAIELIEASERLGASLHAEAGWDAFNAGIEVPADRLVPALGLLAELILRPTFPTAEVDRLRDERLNDILQAKADPRRRAEETFIGTIYASTSPYHRPAGGTTETVERLDASVLRRAWSRGLDPSRATLVVGGDLGGLDVAVVAEDLFGGWTAGAPSEPAAIDDSPDDDGTPRARRASTGFGPDGDPDRPPRPASTDPGLPRRVGDGGHPGRALQLPAQHEAS